MAAQREVWVFPGIWRVYVDLIIAESDSYYPGGVLPPLLRCGRRKSQRTIKAQGFFDVPAWNRDVIET